MTKPSITRSLAVLCASLAALAGGCADDADAACDAYKRAAAAHSICDPNYSILTDPDKPYANFRCVTDEERTTAGLPDTLEECAAYLNDLVDPPDGSDYWCEVSLTEPERCKEGYLIAR